MLKHQELPNNGKSNKLVPPLSAAWPVSRLRSSAAPEVPCTTLQDAVPRVGKFLTLFSRPGKRVIIDYRGDVVVRPSPYEIFIRNG